MRDEGIFIICGVQSSLSALLRLAACSPPSLSFLLPLQWKREDLGLLFQKISLNFYLAITSLTFTTLSSPLSRVFPAADLPPLEGGPTVYRLRTVLLLFALGSHSPFW